MFRTLPLAFGLLLAAQATAFSVVVNVQHATCGNTTGSIWAYTVGAAQPLNWVWSPEPPNGQGTGNITDVSPGLWTVTVTDAMGTAVTEEIELLMTSALFPPIVPQQPVWSCDGGCNGYFNYYVPLIGSPMPYTVVFDPPGPSGGASPNGLYFSSLCPGESYMVTVMDANGCTGVVGPIEVLGNMAPEVLSTGSTGSCPAGATGSFTALFNTVDTVVITGPQGVVNTPTTNPLNVTNLAAGNYTVTAYNTLPALPPDTNAVMSCSTQVVINVPITTDPCGSISGTLYADLDTDCDQGAGDPGMPYRVITIQPGDHFTLTDVNGVYATELFYDNYTLNSGPDGYATVCPTLPAPFALDAVSPAATLDVAMEPLFGPDASAYLVMGVHRPGFPVLYQVSATNQGPYSFTDASLNLFFDPLLTINDNGGGLLLAPGQLQWELADLAPYSSVMFTVSFTVPPNAALIGTEVSGTAALGLMAPDSDPDNDSYTVVTTIIGAYDPNDKLVQTSSALSTTQYFLDQDQWVDYTIRFQNTGTAEAINVFLLDTISTVLDLTSLQILGTSHAFEASIVPGRVLRFDFQNIMLPDSTSDFAGSQGFASFRLRPVGGMLPGSVLSNAADIFFDFNDPIRTNDADLVIALSTSIAKQSRSFLQVHPNPADELLHVVAPDGNWTIEVLGVDGRLAHTSRMSGDRMAMDIARLAPGTYLLRLTETKGTVAVQRFVKR